MVKNAIRSKKKKEKALNDYEQFRLDALKSKLERDWKYIEEAAEERLKKLNAMNKVAAKLMMSYADGYWAVQRPSPKRKEIMISREKTFGKMGDQTQDDEYDGDEPGRPQSSKVARIKLTPQEEYIHLLNKIEKLQISLHINRIRPSAAAAS